jgi:tetratricopeptide (TPR) repeat protein
MVLESGMLRAEAGGWSHEGQLPALAIPATLQDSLEARLERFSTVKEVAQLAATLGREFSYAQLNAVAYVDEPVLVQSLEQLVDAQLVYQDGEPPRATYTFKHALLQEAAYQSLLRSTRLRHHQRIARTFETQFPDVAASQPELLAHHWAAAGMHARAIPYWQRAGMRAMHGSAHAEAVAHLTRGVEALANMEEGPERNRIELQLQASLGTAFTATRGHASKEVRAAFSRARELSQRVGDTPFLSQVLAGLFAFYYVRGDLEAARELGVDLLELAGRLGDPDIALVGHAGLSIARFATGDGRSARPHLDYVLNAYELDRHAPLAVTHGQDFLVVALTHAAQLDWVEGYPDRALAHSRAAVAHAEKLGHAQSLAMALTVHGSMHCFRRELRETKDAAADLMKLATEQEFAHWAVDALFLQAWVLAQRGQRAAAAERAEQAANSYGLEAHLPRHRFDVILVETYRTLARPDEALRIVEATVADRQKRATPGVWEPDIWRLYGELLAGQGADDEARRWLQRAVAEANRRNARMLELRALNSLVRLDDRQGLRSDAAARLEELYATFTEGFDNPDLAECRSLIDTFADSGAA